MTKFLLGRGWGDILRHGANGLKIHVRSTEIQIVSYCRFGQKRV